jgi:hypothetical protein
MGSIEKIDALANVRERFEAAQKVILNPDEGDLRKKLLEALPHVSTPVPNDEKWCTPETRSKIAALRAGTEFVAHVGPREVSRIVYLLHGIVHDVRVEAFEAFAYKDDPDDKK